MILNQDCAKTNPFSRGDSLYLSLDHAHPLWRVRVDRLCALQGHQTIAGGNAPGRWPAMSRPCKGRMGMVFWFGQRAWNGV
jgi:hypothetical protein